MTNKLPDGWERKGPRWYQRADGVDVRWFGPGCWRWVRGRVRGSRVGFRDWLTAHAAMLALNEKYPLEVKDGEG